MFFQPTLAKNQSISLLKESSTRRTLSSFSSIMNKKSTFSNHKSIWRTPKHPRLDLKTNFIFSTLSNQTSPFGNTKTFSSSIYVKELYKASIEEKRPISVCLNNTRTRFICPK